MSSTEGLVEPDYPFRHLNSLIKLISLSTFKNFGRIPRCPDDNCPAKLLQDFTLKEFEESLIVFVSHRWMRELHPDMEDGRKYELCVKGIADLKQVMADKFINCYIWFDYGCIDQSSNPSDEACKQLRSVISICDCLFTPIYDENHATWDFTGLAPDSDPYDDYKSKNWEEYRGRAWCRTEMLYAAHIPHIKENNENRKNKFAAGLLTHQMQGRRPHFLFGSKEVAKNHPPRALPPLLDSYLTLYNPLYGSTKVERDKDIIEVLYRDLMPLKSFPVGYQGEYNSEDKKYGFGKEIFKNGNIYKGDWLDDEMHGKGKLINGRGDLYDGDFKMGDRDGTGEIIYSNGSVYKGAFKNNKRHGFGTFLSAFRDHQYEGEYYKNEKHGMGKMTFADGSFYEGGFENDEMNGEGKLTNNVGIVTNGIWKNGKLVS